MVINQKFFFSGTRSLLHRSPNMDTLVALGSGASFCWSVYALFKMTSGSAVAAQYAQQLYFESAAMILALITVGKLLEAKSKGKTTNALKALIRLKPSSARVMRDGKETLIPADQLRAGDIFIVRAGDKIPADGSVKEGDAAVNEAALTGESIPVDKAAGDHVSAATICASGFIRCEATKVGEDTVLAQIIQTVSDAAATQAPIAKIADKVSGIFVPTVIILAALTFLIWLLAGKEFSFTLARAVSVLVISCPCALGLATPVAITVGNGLGAKKGILFKSAESLEQAGKIQIAVFDKTGTLTEGTPVVTDILPADGFSQEELLRFAYSLESKSEHPLAAAVCKKALAEGVNAEEITDYRTHAGSGVSGSLGSALLQGGSYRFVRAHALRDDSMERIGQALAGEGKTPLYFSKDNQLIGMIAVQDTAKQEAAQVIAKLKKMGIRSVMLTGDNEATANAIGKGLNLDTIIAGVLPDQKAKVIKELRKSGITAMIGDGINDAPALTEADIGIAIGSGTDVALDAADVVLMKNSLSDVPAAIRLGRKTLRTIRQNLFWAFFYNAICIPIAAGALIPRFGIMLNPMMGAAAMSLSSFFVVTNALRINLFDVYSDKRDKPKKAAEIKNLPHPEEKGERKMTIQVKGMMCPHCEARVKSALEALPGIEQALPSHEKGEVVLTLSGEVEKQAIAKAVTDAGYTFVE